MQRPCCGRLTIPFVPWPPIVRPCGLLRPRPRFRLCLCLRRLRPPSNLAVPTRAAANAPPQIWRSLHLPSRPLRPLARPIARGPTRKVGATTGVRVTTLLILGKMNPPGLVRPFTFLGPRVYPGQPVCRRTMNPTYHLCRSLTGPNMVPPIIYLLPNGPRRPPRLRAQRPADVDGSRSPRGYESVGCTLQSSYWWSVAFAGTFPSFRPLLHLSYGYRADRIYRSPGRLARYMIFHSAQRALCASPGN